MNKHSKLTLVALALFFSALMSAAANAQSAPAPDYVRPPVSKATTPPAPKVALVGDWITYYWSGTPANYINANPTPAGYALMTQMLDHVCHGGFGIA